MYVSHRLSNEGSETLWQSTRGAVAIEFAVVVGALLILILGTLQTGLALQARNEVERTITHVARAVHLAPDNPARAVTARSLSGESCAGFADQLPDDRDGQIKACLAMLLSHHRVEKENVSIAGATPEFDRIRVNFSHRLNIPLVSNIDIEMRVSALANRG